MAMIAPRVVEPDEDASTLRITWADDHESAIPYQALRDHCPCAHCKHARDQQQPIFLVPGMSTRLLSWKRIGNYALNFSWGDSHTDGIFAYDYLRGLCPCGVCEPIRR